MSLFLAFLPDLQKTPGEGLSQVRIKESEPIQDVWLARASFLRSSVNMRAGHYRGDADINLYPGQWISSRQDSQQLGLLVESLKKLEVTEIIGDLGSNLGPLKFPSEIVLTPEKHCSSHLPKLYHKTSQKYLFELPRKGNL